jgi:alpha-amylase
VGMGGAGSGNSQPLPNDTAAGVFVHLFEWRWTDVANECETFLGPKGFAAVQVSPPNEHAVLASNDYPWWQRYQPVSYRLEQSRSGTRDEFVAMVARCRAAGVGIYVDAVINHTTAQASGVGSAGTAFTKYEYPGLYTKADFHSPVCTIQGEDYASSANNVQQCELLGLADLNTSSPAVQAKLAGYLSELAKLGVRGFRIDAAKHMSPADLTAILEQVNAGATEKPYYFFEVIDHGGEAVHAADYLSSGAGAELDVTEFKYEAVGDVFLNRSPRKLPDLKELSETGWGILPSDRAVVFINNHDTQRNRALYYQDGVAHDLASVFMLAWPYGYPSVMSSFAFDRGTSAGLAAGPPSEAPGTTRPVYAAGGEPASCAAPPFGPDSAGWICEHRSRSIANMVGFRKAVAGAEVASFWDNGASQIAFARGDRGFVAINMDATTLSETLVTGLAEGRYCDVLSGDFDSDQTGSSCTGTSITVNAAGLASLTLAAGSALALHVNAKL